MKTTTLTIICILISIGLLAQAPLGINHQAVIRDAEGKLVANNIIGIQVSILQSEIDGTAVYIETHSPESNANGLVTYVIGRGTVLDGIFGEIDWSDGPYFLKTEVDPAGGINYSIIGATQLLSVPYTLYAKTAETITGGIIETDPSVPTGTQPGEMQYWDGTEWITVPAGNTGQVLTFILGVPTWGPQLGMNDVQNPATGKIWMDRNLGASQVATSSTDANAYGDFYQWGRGPDGHQIRTSGTTTTLSSSDTPGHGDFIEVHGSSDWRIPQNHNLWQGVNGVNNPCPIGYRLPTIAELNAERLTWSSDNSAGAFASPLKLPVAGFRFFDGPLSGVGSRGACWSSTIDGVYSRYLYFKSSEAYVSSYDRAYGNTVRCIKE